MDAALWLVGGLGLGGLVAIDEFNRRRQARRARERLASSWGQPLDGARDLAAVASWHEHVILTGRATSMDARTWKDLDLDDVFAFLDRTASSIGRQALYDRLRSTSHAPETLITFDTMAEAIRLDATLRGQIQGALHELRSPAGYDLWRLAHLPIPDPSRWTRLSPVIAAAMLAMVLAAWLMPTLLAAVVRT